MINNFNGKDSHPPGQQSYSGQAEWTPFDADGTEDLGADLIFEKRTPCGRDIMPVTVERGHGIFHVDPNRCVEQETKYMVDLRGIVEPESEIREWHRNGIINWMIDAQVKLDLNDFTLFLAINIFNRCLAKWFVNQKNIYLVGVTCLWIAHKFEEVGEPWGDQYVAIRGFQKYIFGRRTKSQNSP